MEIGKGDKEGYEDWVGLGVYEKKRGGEGNKWEGDKKGLMRHKMLQISARYKYLQKLWVSFLSHKIVHLFLLINTVIHTYCIIYTHTYCSCLHSPAFHSLWKPLPLLHPSSPLPHPPIEESHFCYVLTVYCYNHVSNSLVLAWDFFAYFFFMNWLSAGREMKSAAIQTM